MREAENKTLQQFSTLIGIHLQALYLNESGVYPTILPVVGSYMSRKGYNLEEMEIAYQEFVSERREEFFEKWAPYSLPEPFLGDSPVGKWRATLGLSRAGLAKGLCVHPGQLHRVETGRAQALPNQLVEALKAVRFPDDLIEELNDRVEEYYFSKA